MASLQTLAQQQKARILKREAAARKHLASDYHALWQSILKRLAKLEQEMQASWESGTPLPPTWIYEQHRLAKLLDAIHLDVQQFAQVAMIFTQGQVAVSWQTGEEDALSLLDSRGLGIEFGRPMPEALHILAARASGNMQIAQLYRRLPQMAVDMVRKRLLAGIALGQNPRTVAASIRNGLDMPLNQALRIARTEMMTAYRSGSLSIYRANADVVRGWTWLAAAGACDFCEGMNGSHHSLGEELASHPNCRCTMVPDTLSYEDILAA
jgi:SPP1 gp7 family putative phage head morphogenesis protein